MWFGSKRIEIGYACCSCCCNPSRLCHRDAAEIWRLRLAGQLSWPLGIFDRPLTQLRSVRSLSTSRPESKKKHVRPCNLQIPGGSIVVIGRERKLCRPIGRERKVVGFTRMSTSVGFLKWRHWGKIAEVEKERRKRKNTQSVWIQSEYKCRRVIHRIYDTYIKYHTTYITWPNHTLSTSICRII